DITLRTTDFGPSVHGDSGLIKLQRAARAPVILRSVAALARYARKHRIQIVHGTEKPRDALFAVTVARLAGARSVVHAHVAYGDWMSPLTKWAFRQADAIVGVSRFTADSYLEAGYDARRVFAVHNS